MKHDLTKRVLMLFGVFGVFGLLGLSSCSFLKENMFRPSREPEVDQKETYYGKGAGAQNQIEMGPDTQTLLEGFTKLKSDFLDLKAKMEQVESHNEQLRARLSSTEQNLTAEMSKRAVAEAEADRFKKEIRKRDAEFLSLSIKLARREHEYYALKVAALKDQLDTLNAAAYEAAAQSAPVGGGKR